MPYSPPPFHLALPGSACRPLGRAETLGRIVAASFEMRGVLRAIRAAAATAFPVLVTGESGVGKELVAEAIHQCGPRAAGPFIAINCAALPAELAESELFGHVRGAFTGAAQSRDGAFVAAHGGTLFLDEIGEMPLALQAKLLRVLETWEVRPVGATRGRKVDVRVVAATHRSLPDLVALRRFREDLFYRLDVLALCVPPLRDRPEDIRPIAHRLLEAVAHTQGISEDALVELEAHRWPGNVRELRNVLCRAAHHAPDRLIEARDVERALRPRASAARPVVVPRPRAIVEHVNEVVSSTLAAHHGSGRRTYEALGIPKSTFYRWRREGRISAQVVEV